MFYSISRDTRRKNRHRNLKVRSNFVINLDLPDSNPRPLSRRNQPSKTHREDSKKHRCDRKPFYLPVSRVRNFLIAERITAPGISVYTHDAETKGKVCGGLAHLRARAHQRVCPKVERGLLRCGREIEIFVNGLGGPGRTTNSLLIRM